MIPLSNNPVYMTTYNIISLIIRIRLRLDIQNQVNYVIIINRNINLEKQF